jgi:putative transposase
MTYSTDLRERVVDYVRSGGRKVDACGLFGVGRETIYRWLGSKDLQPKTYTRKKPRKIDPCKLRDHVRQHPHMLSKERAVHFGVSSSGMCRALKRVKITRKKSN